MKSFSLFLFSVDKKELTSLRCLASIQDNIMDMARVLKSSDSRLLCSSWNPSVCYICIQHRGWARAPLFTPPIRLES